MTSAFIRTTSGPTFALVAVACAVGCGGASAKEVQEAQTSGYATDFARVYTATLGSVQKLYPKLLRENAGAGVIETRWHALSIKQGAQGQFDGASGPRQQSNSQYGFGRKTARVFFLIRFRVAVIGGNPWRIRIEGRAAKLEEGLNDNTPMPLRGADRPPWLDGRTNALRVAIHRQLAKHAVKLDKQLLDPDKGKKRKPLVAKDFGKIPKAANKMVNLVRQAADERQYNTLRKYMIDSFVWSTGGEPDADQAIMMWQADSGRLSRLVTALDQGCGRVATISVAGQSHASAIVCPSEAIAPTYPGERAVFARQSKTWRLAAFASAE